MQDKTSNLLPHNLALRTYLMYTM